MDSGKKLEILTSALLKIAMGTSDVLTSQYCVTILLEVGEEDAIEEMLSQASNGKDPELS